MEKVSDGRKGSQITKYLKGHRLRWNTKTGKHARKQVKVEECLKTEGTNHLPFSIAFLFCVEPVTSFKVSFRSHKNLFLSNSHHGCHQQDSNEEEESEETLKSEYSYYHFKSGKLMCSQKQANP